MYYRNDLEEDDIEELFSKYAEQNPSDTIPNLNITVNITRNISELDLNKMNKKKKNLVVFDDFSEDKNQDKQIDFFQNGRHRNTSVIYLTHRFHTQDFGRIRANTSAFILFEQNQKTLEQIIRDLNIPMDRKEFYAFCKSAFTRRDNTENKKYIYFKGTATIRLPSVKYDIETVAVIFNSANCCIVLIGGYK